MGEEVSQALGPAHSSPGRSHVRAAGSKCQSAWMKTVRPSMGKHWTGVLARGLTASMPREVIVTVKAAKASNHPKSRGRKQKYVFTLDDAMLFVFLRLRHVFLI